MAKRGQKSRERRISGGVELGERFPLSGMRRRYRDKLIYPIGESGQLLIVMPCVLNHFAEYQQTVEHASEAGGQLFARFVGNEIRIECATGPRPTDRRSRFFYTPDRNEEQHEIDKLHKRGFHFIGDWHTHPQLLPSPSHSDLRSIRDAVTLSEHHLNAFVMIIVGTEQFPRGLYVSAHGPKDQIEIRPLTETGALG